MFDIITIGSGVIDAYVKSKAARQITSRLFATGEGECFALGSKIEVDKFLVTTGGGATNAAATFAHLGFKVAAAARVGDDFFGAAIIDDLAKRGIATDLVMRARSEHTGFSTILVAPDGDRTVLVFRGAAEKFVWSEFKTSKLKAKWFYVSSLAGQIKVLEQLFAFAKRNGIKIFWNPGAKELKHGLAKLQPLLHLAEIVMINREEAALLTGQSGSNVPAMMTALTTNVPQVIITDGRAGSYYANGADYFVAGTRGIKAVNATGAGDAFGAGFLVGMMKWQNPAWALQLGTINAEGTIQKPGAKEGLLEFIPARLVLNKVKVQRQTL